MEDTMDFVLWHPGNNTFWFCSNPGSYAVQITGDDHSKLGASDRVESFALSAEASDAILVALNAPEVVLTDELTGDPNPPPAG
jgi:hypothetical protein